MENMKRPRTSKWDQQPHTPACSSAQPQSAQTASQFLQNFKKRKITPAPPVAEEDDSSDSSVCESYEEDGGNEGDVGDEGDEGEEEDEGDEGDEDGVREDRGVDPEDIMDEEEDDMEEDDMEELHHTMKEAKELEIQRLNRAKIAKEESALAIHKFEAQRVEAQRQMVFAVEEKDRLQGKAVKAETAIRDADTAAADVKRDLAYIDEVAKQSVDDLAEAAKNLSRAKKKQERANLVLQANTEPTNKMCVIC